ncbi:Uncharacterized protein GBIM_07607 [Gryllus bimaculatus]|nr:Uncharacterized protein GBIM_07607 [Gryllus bimaculatus]
MDSWSDDDDWFYESIKRYDLLLMFDFSSPVKFIEFNDLDSVCLIFEEENCRNELSCFSLPKKLTVLREHEGLEKDSDFRLLSGGFSQKSVIQVKILKGTNTMLASEKDLCGLSVYKIPSENSGIIHHTNTIHNELLSPKLSHNKLDSLAMADTNKKNVVLLDTKGFVVKGKIKTEEYEEESVIIPEFVSPHSLGLCNTETGSVSIYDTRCATKCSMLHSAQPFPKTQWTLSSSFLSTSHIADSTDETKLGLLSTSGIISVLDTRNPQHTLSCEKGKDICSRSAKRNIPKIQFCPSKFPLLSISGFNPNIYIYDFSSENMKNIFVHDGHHRSSSTCENITTDHVWYKNSVMSACDNLSVHCWEYTR